jgi:hypothetical protein
MNLEFYRDSVSYHGLGATLYHAAYRAANHMTEIAVWNALAITADMVHERFLGGRGRASGRMLEAAEMRPYVLNRENLLTDRFIDEAGAKGDKCYALFDGDTIMSYGWYSTKPTRLTEAPGEPMVSFDPSYAYTYNGFTRPEYRGRRLHAVGMAAALDELTDEGISGMLASVGSSDFSSIKSCYRMGYETCGYLLMFRAGGRNVWHGTHGCKKYGFRVEEAAS